MQRPCLPRGFFVCFFTKWRHVAHVSPIPALLWCEGGAGWIESIEQPPKAPQVAPVHLQVDHTVRVDAKAAVVHYAVMIFSVRQTANARQILRTQRKQAIRVRAP
jgi:hypothetical protein